MTIERAGAAALILGTIAMLGVMALHPSGVAHADEAAKTLLLGRIVHDVAIGAAPALTFGLFALTRSIGFDRPGASLAFFFYLFGALTVMLAATMSGLIAPRLMELQLAKPAEQAEIHNLLRLEWFMNQAFATLHVALFSIAIALWSLVWPERGVLAAAIQIVGLLVGVGILAWLFSGMLTLNVHGMGAVVIAHGAWIILAAIGLAARKKGDP